MISIFVPIFLIDKLSIGILNVALFELFFFILSIFFHYYLVTWTGKVGAKKIMISSYFLNCLLFFTLYQGELINSILGGFIFILFIALLNALASTTYWTAHHLYFLRCTRVEESGTKLGILNSVPVIASISGPFIGSILIVELSYNAVFLFNIFILFIASLSLMFSKDLKVSIKLNKKRIVDKENIQKNAIYFAQGLAYCSTGFIWPILIFVSSIEIITIGSLMLFANIGQALVVYLGGKAADNDTSGKFITIGTFGHGASIFLRALYLTPVFITTFWLMGGLFGGLRNITIDSNFFKHSHRDSGNKIMNRELYMHLGRIMTVFIFLMSLAVFGFYMGLISTLLIVGVINLLVSFVTYKNNVKL
ncbi:hypothetical protein C0583_04135 [Candidatus Parcubacteria bacterium]|nr:MAG: hypothetical protein C0583_04135 [Candidatus Parcubacteria bacterium]